MIRWVNEKLGTAPWNAQPFEAGVSALDVRDFVDGEGNSIEAIRARVEQGVELLRAGFKVVVCCDYGMSRSNALAAGILARSESISLETAIRRVLETTGEKQIKLAMLATVRSAVGTSLPPAGQTNRVLVTGGSGLVGATLGQMLEPNLSRFPSRQEIDLTRDTIPLDLFVKDNNIDVILHLAHPRIPTTSESMGTALTMLKNVLMVCVENRTRFVHVSCCEVFHGYAASELRVDEQLVPRSGSTNGQTKRLCEALVEFYGEQYGLEWTIIRPTTLYGSQPNRPRFIWNFIEHALRSEDIVTHRLKNGFPSVDLLHVDDACDALVAILNSKFAGIMNIGSGVAVAPHDIAAQVVALCGSTSSIKHQSVERELHNIVVDNGLAARILGWTPKVSLDVALQEMIERARTIIQGSRA